MKTSIIICTYNEEKTISNVVISCCVHNPDSEIIVVDDGSVDNTENLLLELAKKYIFRYERLKQNKGKSWAMVHGVEISTNDIILFFDADVSNIKKEHFDILLTPIFNNEADLVLGQPSETLIDYRVNPFKTLTGQRALLKKDIVPILNDIRTIRFGVETYINLYYQAQGKRIKYVLLKELKHPTKYEKTTPIKATKEFINEGKEIAITLVKNYDLITQRIELQFNRANENEIKKINRVQNEINNHLLSLINSVDKFIEE
ncbi:MAG: glycosyltransferase family 2 protein [Bacteroidales bacterium]|nr:glycosyltransferase family 2 protein [Bacteroidales bacterium]